jgi:hypothetical protein
MHGQNATSGQERKASDCGRVERLRCYRRDKHLAEPPNVRFQLAIGYEILINL